MPVYTVILNLLSVCLESYFPIIQTWDAPSRHTGVGASLYYPFPFTSQQTSVCEGKRVYCVRPMIVLDFAEFTIDHVVITRGSLTVGGSGGPVSCSSSLWSCTRLLPIHLL